MHFKFPQQKYFGLPNTNSAMDQKQSQGELDSDALSLTLLQILFVTPHNEREVWQKVFGEKLGQGLYLQLPFKLFLIHCVVCE